MIATLKNKIIRKYKYIYQNISISIYGIILRRRIKKKNFTIICNNCFGGTFYQALKKPYDTPTVGLYFMAQDYIKFLSNLKFYIDSELKFAEESKYPHLKNAIYPIGILNDEIEIQFLHYTSKEEAFDKWERRKKRINWDKLFIIWNDRDMFSDQLLKDFEELPFVKKVFFSSKNRPGSTVVWLKYYQDKEQVSDLTQDRFKIWHYFNFAKWFNS